MNQVSQAQFGNIPMQFIEADPKQPRKTFDPIKLQELADSIASTGILEPIILRTVPDSDTRLQIVAGERRFRAAKLAGLQEVPGIVRQLTDAQVAIIQLVENHQRDGVPALEEAEAMQSAMSDHGLTIDEICDQMGVKKRWAYTRLQLTKLSPDVKPALMDGRISASTAILIAAIPSHTIQERATAEILRNNGNSEPMSYRVAKQTIENRFMLRFEKAFFALDDAKLNKAAGACTVCPKRTSNSPDIYGDISADVCTDADCFKGKNDAFNDAQLANAKRKHIPVFNDWNECKKEVGADLTTGFKLAHQFDRLAIEDAGQPIEKLLTPQQLPKPIGAYKDHQGKVVPVFSQTAIQAALEKAGLALTVEQEQKLLAAEPLIGVPVKSCHDLGRLQAIVIAEAYTKLHAEIFEEIKDRLAPEHLLRVYREMARISAAAGVNTMEISMSHAAIDSYDIDLKDTAVVATFLQEVSDEDVCRLHLDAYFSLLGEVRVGDIKDGRLDYSARDEDDELPWLATLLAIAEICSVDLNTLRDKHLGFTYDAIVDPRAAILREGWDAAAGAHTPYNWHDPRADFWAVGQAWHERLGFDAEFPALDNNCNIIGATQPIDEAVAAAAEASTINEDGEDLAEQAAEQEATPKPSRKRKPKTSTNEAWPFPTAEVIAARKAEEAAAKVSDKQAGAEA